MIRWRLCKQGYHLFVCFSTQTLYKFISLSLFTRLLKYFLQKQCTLTAFSEKSFLSQAFISYCCFKFRVEFLKCSECYLAQSSPFLSRCYHSAREAKNFSTYFMSLSEVGGSFVLRPLARLKDPEVTSPCPAVKRFQLRKREDDCVSRQTRNDRRTIV